MYSIVHPQNDFRFGLNDSRISVYFGRGRLKAPASDGTILVKTIHHKIRRVVQYVLVLDRHDHVYVFTQFFQGFVDVIAFRRPPSTNQFPILESVLGPYHPHIDLDNDAHIQCIYGLDIRVAESDL